MTTSLNSLHLCGDESHSIFSDEPGLEQYARRVCRIPKRATQYKDNSGYEVYYTYHQVGAIRQDMLGRVHERIKTAWLAKRVEQSDLNNAAEEKAKGTKVDGREVTAVEDEEAWDIVEKAEAEATVDVSAGKTARSYVVI